MDKFKRSMEEFAKFQRLRDDLIRLKLEHKSAEERETAILPCCWKNGNGRSNVKHSQVTLCGNEEN